MRAYTKCMQHIQTKTTTHNEDRRANDAACGVRVTCKVGRGPKSSNEVMVSAESVLLHAEDTSVHRSMSHDQ